MKHAQCLRHISANFTKPNWFGQSYSHMMKHISWCSCQVAKRLSAQENECLGDWESGETCLPADHRKNLYKFATLQVKKYIKKARDVARFMQWLYNRAGWKTKIVTYLSLSCRFCWYTPKQRRKCKREKNWAYRKLLIWFFSLQGNYPKNTK